MSRKRKTSSQGLLATGATKKFRQSRMDESFDPKWQQDLDVYFLQWLYVSGIPFHATRRHEFNTFRKHLATCPPRVHPSMPNHHRICGDGIVQQHKGVAEMLAMLRRDVAATRATILTDGRKSITPDQIANFLAAGFSGAYLLRTILRDGAEQDTASVVVRRWKKIFDDFGIENVNAICMESAGTYVAAAKLLAQNNDLRYSHITWLPYAVHVCSLMLSAIGKDGRDGVVGHREDTIIRARARGVGYVLPWEDEDVITAEERPKPRDSGVHPADKVSDEQLDRHVWKGRKDSLTRQSASVERYFDRRATIFLPHEEEVVYDPEPDPLSQYKIEEEPWSDPEDLDVESGQSSDDDVPLALMRRETRDDDDDRGYEGSSESDDDMDFGRGAEDARPGGDDGPRDITAARQQGQRCSARLAEERDRGGGGAARGGGDGRSGGQTPLSPQRGRSEAAHHLTTSAGDLVAATGSVTDFLGMSMGPPPTPLDAGHALVAASETPISQVVRGLDIDGGLSSSLLMEAAQGMKGTPGWAMRSMGDVVDRPPTQEMDVETDVDRRDREERQRALTLAQFCLVTQDIRATLDAARALETGVTLAAAADRRDTHGTGERNQDAEEVQEGDGSQPAEGDGGVCRPGLDPIRGEDDDAEGGGDGAVGGGDAPHGGSDAVARHDACEEDRRTRVEGIRRMPE
ncbi:hypothetical protein CBR_g38821 [Chara braunii]|uniref:DUF659 domain-containing protein n=1 Tax=Chara braunii TaxID=69332 RepID=A0A388LQK5_CHABU|nr:hypothetical protein CBR_g38821 [Chara braunii]|eukprot:GBG84539.1 hypothetical protein CBR_g38821 [Chara braunii]